MKKIKLTECQYRSLESILTTSIQRLKQEYTQSMMLNDSLETRNLVLGIQFRLKDAEELLKQVTL